MRYLGQVIFSVLITIVWFTAGSVVRIFSHRYSFALFKAWGKFQLRWFGINWKLTDENRGNHPRAAVWMLMNQDSLLEIFYIPTVLPFPFRLIINLEFALVPIIGWFTYLICGYVVIRQSPKQSRKTFTRAVRMLRRGENVGVSIEGFRPSDGKLGPFKKGPALIAIEAQVPIVPMIVKGAAECWPFGSWRIRPGAIEVVLKPQVSTLGLIYADRDLLIAQLRELTIKELNIDRKV